MLSGKNNDFVGKLENQNSEHMSTETNLSVDATHLRHIIFPTRPYRLQSVTSYDHGISMKVANFRLLNGCDGVPVVFLKKLTAVSSSLGH